MDGKERRPAPEVCDWCKKPPKAGEKLHVIGYNPAPGDEVYVCESCLDEKRTFHQRYIASIPATPIMTYRDDGKYHGWTSEGVHIAVTSQRFHEAWGVLTEQKEANADQLIYDPQTWYGLPGIDIY